MDSNPLPFLPAKVRRAVYIGYGIVALAVSATQVGYASLSYQNPPWLTVAIAVVGFLAVPVGAIAASNVQPSDSDPPT